MKKRENYQKRYLFFRRCLVLQCGMFGGYFMSQFKQVESSYVSFEAYKEIVEKYTTEDYREINYQNRVIIRMLDKIFINDEDIAIVDVSTQYKNRESNQHTRKPYANDRTPDILIVKNWKYNNKDIPKENYLAVVEVKSPVLDPISKENEHTDAETKAYLSNGNRVILTDCFKWEFYGFENEPKTFILHDGNNWVMEEVKNPEFIVNELGFHETRTESKVWNNLCRYISEKVNIDNFNVQE